MGSKSNADCSGTAAGGRTDGFEGGDPRVRQLVRQSHIFASVVREFLEIKLLREICTFSLTLPQFRLLELLAHNGHHQVSDVAGLLGVSTPAACKNIDKLERLGLVLRQSSKGDRRATLLTARAGGRRLVRRYRSRTVKRMQPVLDELSREELDRLTELLERFSVCLVSHESVAQGPCLRCAAYFEAECPIGAVLSGCPYRARRNYRSLQSSLGEL